MMNKQKNNGKIVHEPVLLEEVCEAFDLIAPLNNQVEEKTKPVVVDATLGGGGHAMEFIKRGAYVLGIDADEKMVRIAGENLQQFVESKFACPTDNYHKYFEIVHANFRDIDEIAGDQNIEKVDAVLFDLGISSYHYQFSEKGFSFKDPKSALDMRMSEAQKVTAADLLNALSKDQLTNLFSETLPFFQAQKLSRMVISFRQEKAIVTTGDFSDIINSAFGKNRKFNSKRKISLPTLPYLALRMAVNFELDNLRTALPKAWKLLKTNGTLAVISFHSGEDRIVKEIFGNWLKNGEGAIYKKLTVPSSDEISKNPRSRSSKLRIIKK